MAAEVDDTLTADERSVPDHDRTGATEDLIGSVFVQDGKVSICVLM